MVESDDFYFNGMKHSGGNDLFSRVVGASVLFPDDFIVECSADGKAVAYCKQRRYVYLHIVFQSPCDGPVGDGPCTKPTCADTAPGAQEQPGAGTNERCSSAMTSGMRNGNPEEGVEKRLASESGRRAARSEGIGERFPPSRGEEDKEAADGGLNTAVAREAKQRTPPRFWRSVAQAEKKRSKNK
ncbi:hypothetical protein NDU88_001792 [Pleurodeles waltl]|uniref:Uncharacterized protein n=1 Tax=Pleurodeles waltl TaxID=8319 RepID=A0AAV7Q740_PLEWA|nr:hypothetical protein NDU88_001792 [Pleurodeles waltl]